MRVVCIVLLLAVLIVSSGCMGIQAPIIGSMPKMDIAIQPVPNRFIDKTTTVIPTPTANLTPTPIPRFKYV